MNPERIQGAFNGGRWLLLVAKHWSENRKRYLFSLGAIASLLILWFAFMLFMNPYTAMDEDLQVATYYFGLFLVGCFYASILFDDLSSTPRGIGYLTLPASQAEKLLCNIFYGVVIFFVCYTLIFYLVNFSMIRLGNAVAYSHWQDQGAQGIFHPRQIADVFYDPNTGRQDRLNSYFLFLLAYLAVQSAFAAGSIYFPKYSFIKTVIFLLVAALLYVFFIGKVIFPILPDGALGGVTVFRLSHHGRYDQVVQLPQWIGIVLVFLLKYITAPVLWTVTYFRLKEKEI